MKKQVLYLLVAILSLVNGLRLSAQVGINSDGSQPDPSAGLDVKFNNKGFLPPRVNIAQRNAIASPASGLVIYNTECNDLQFFNGTDWVPVGNVGMLTTPSVITGNLTPCVNATSVNYSIAAIPGATGYNWTPPAGAIITSGQGTTSVNVNFGSSGGLVCVSAFNSCMKSNMACIEVALLQNSPVSVSIIASANPVCPGTLVTFTATPVNGGANPVYQWKVNGANAGANSNTFSFSPSNNDVVTCVLTSGLTCATGTPATSNAITMNLLPIPGTPAAGTHVPSQTQIVWNWGTVPGATGYKFNTVNNYSTATDMGTTTTKTETGLTCNTAYTRYVWAYASCAGLPVTLIQTTSACQGFTCGASAITDPRDGQVYPTTLIGTQCWLKKNLNYGNMVPGSNEQLNNSIPEKYCYDNDLENCNEYGGLYQWAEMVQYLNGASNTTSWDPVPTGNVQGLCLQGWHLPTDEEWNTLVAFLGGESIAGGKMKEAGLTHWLDPNFNATNSSGFTGVGSGECTLSASFSNLKHYSDIWSCTENGASYAWDRFLTHDYEDLDRDWYNKRRGFAVRCLKDN